MEFVVDLGNQSSELIPHSSSCFWLFLCFRMGSREVQVGWSKIRMIPSSVQKAASPPCRAAPYCQGHLHLYAQHSMSFLLLVLLASYVCQISCTCACPMTTAPPWSEDKMKMFIAHVRTLCLFCLHDGAMCSLICPTSDSMGPLLSKSMQTPGMATLAVLSSFIVPPSMMQGM